MRRTDLPRSTTILVALVLAFGAVGNGDYAEELIVEAEAKEIRPQIAKQHPWDAPRCPKVNSEGEWLRVEYAHNADGTGWRYGCTYTEAKL